ncbi:MAG: hypothetical protein ACFFCS_23225 [Candidatus Hodarchaeota archaeon]
MRKHRHKMYFLLMIFFAMLAILSNSITTYMYWLYFFLFYTGHIARLGITLSSILLADSISREAIDIKKIALFCVVSTLLVVFLLLIYVFNIIYVPSTPEDNIFYQVLYTAWAFLYWLNQVIGLTMIMYWAIKVHVSSPSSLKRYSRLSLIGSIVFFLVPLEMVVENLGITYTFYLGVDFLEIGIGTLFIAISFIKEPKLAFVLPFKVLRLSIFETEGGIMLYTHTWVEDEELVNEELFSSMVQGIRVILKEGVKRGNVRDIHLENATLILQHSEKHPIACVLITTRSSRSLRDALDTFMNRFIDEHSEKFSALWETEAFKGTSKIVEECFPFVPKYE